MTDDLGAYIREAAHSAVRATLADDATPAEALAAIRDVIGRVGTELGREPN
jgi:hypothetical protein